MPTVKCEVCLKRLAKRWNLKQHMRKFHPEEFVAFDVKRTYKYCCELCDKRFNHLYRFNYHLHKIHNQRRKQRQDKHICPLCDNNFSINTSILDHITSVHNIHVEKEIVTFSTLDDFNVWKEKTEKETCALFVKKRAGYKSKNFDRVTYSCNRSGFYEYKGKGKRSLKVQGSNKINGYCPAAMRLLIKESECEVEFTKTHVGHENDLRYLRLSDIQKQRIARKIESKVPVDTILDEIKDSVVNSELERVHLLTKKDLANIKQSYNIKSSRARLQYESIGFSRWINDIESTGCVLLYKPPGKLLQSCSLRENDFFLAIMTTEQQEMLRTYGTDGICIDRTHSLNSYGFELHTIMILHQIRAGFPCGFLLSNRVNEKVLKLFFSLIQEEVGHSIQTSVFVSDMPDLYFRAWIQVMDDTRCRMYCPWHVEHDWSNKLNKISSKLKQVEVYRQLKTLMRETDEVVFDARFARLLTILARDEETHDFYEYIATNYQNNVNYWASSHIILRGLNPVTDLETMHRTIKHLYLNGNNIDQIDKAVIAILKFVRDKYFCHDLMENEEKLCLKITDQNLRHANSEVLDFDIIIASEEGWDILATESDEKYFIQEGNQHCKCEIVCSDCDICLHYYSCTCPDSSIGWNICEHIHLLHRYLCTTSPPDECKESVEDQDTADETVDPVDNDDETSLPEEDLVVCTRQEEIVEPSIAIKKINIEKEIFDVINLVQTEAELAVVENCCKTMKLQLAALQNIPTQANMVNLSSTTLKDKDPPRIIVLKKCLIPFSSKK